MLNQSKLAADFMKTGKLATTIIDSHTHMKDVYGTCLSIYEMEDCIKVMDEENIEQIWCAPHNDLFDPLSLNHEIEEMMNKYKDRVKGYFAFNPNYADNYKKRMDNILKIDNYIGFKFLPEYHKYPLDGENYRQALEFANTYSMAILIHTWGGSPFNDVHHIEGLATKYKNVQFIMGHSAPNNCDGAIALSKQFPNVYLDLCDIHRHSGIVEKMVNEVGAKKVLFGTDLPWYDPNYCTGSVLFSKISDTDKELIFNKNAKRILKTINK